MKRLVPILAVVGGLLLGGGSRALASGDSAGQLTVDDKAGVFTAEGIKKAEEKFHGTTFKAPTQMTVVTAAKVPEAKRGEFEATKGNAAERNRFYRQWAEEQAKARGARGVFVLISMEGGHVHAIDDRQTDVYRKFTDEDLRAVQAKLKKGFEDATKEKDGAKSKQLRDAGLLDAVSFVAAELKDTTVPTTSGNARTHTDGSSAKSGGSMSIGGWICLGLVILLGVWIVIALIRALTGMGGGGGYGPSGGGFGGGGGGFFSSFLGGMFGAAAGMWMYDSFFGGHSAMGGHDTSSGYTDAGGPTDTGAGDYAGGGDGGGADFGDSGGGDTGGGDFGGGDFGGGDFGGGGGDFGGGDW